MTAPAALSLLKFEQFDAIVTDFQMPGMDGIELLKALRMSGNTSLHSSSSQAEVAKRS
jgi:CheY-like chemotaxis protein